MAVRSIRRRDGATVEPRRKGPLTYGRSMASVAVLPRRYYLLPATINAMHFTVTAIPKWIDKREQRSGTNSPPMVVTVAVLAIAGRGLLRAAGAGPRAVQRSHR
ncbi:hypothetical protein ACVBEQ_22465 [Nakamurella sp. GG22]